MKIVCVVVCYRPQVQPLLALCASLLANHAQVVVVDNTESPCLRGDQFPRDCTLITLGTNTGIAHAQNVGVDAALKAGADVIAFFDQDSTISPGFLTALTAPMKAGTAEVVSPLYRDDASNAELPSLRVNKYGISSTVHRGDERNPYAVDVVISSGTAATREVFPIVGPLDESFFIDFVDTEWCLRCRSKNIPIRVVPAAVMRHRIGNRAIHLGITTVLVHNPIRCYYQLRNCFLLFRRKHIPILFALKQSLAVFVSRALLLLFVPDRSAYAKAYLSALRDGLKGIWGRKPA